MMREELRRAKQASPFRPFVIRMTSGQEYEIPHPDFIFVPPEGRIIVVYTKDERALTHVSLPLVESLEFDNDQSGESRRSG